MLTPAFELQQDSTFLIIIIKARYAKVTETEVFVDGTDFKFHSKPYFLRLNLPGRLLEDGREKAAYDVETGTFTVRIPKETQGEEFRGLDLLTKLLAPSGQTSAKEPSIEVLGNDKEMDQSIGASNDEEEFDWQIEQEPFYGDDESKLGGSSKYGFANRRSGVFKRLRDEICGVVDLEDVDSISVPERKRARMMAEREKFDDSHYLADLYQDDAIQPLLQFKPAWVLNYQKMREKMVQAGDLSAYQDVTVNVSFTDEEKELMVKLPRKEFILSNIEEDGALLGVADILFAYAYNVRTNEGENSVESAWTVCKLSSTLSCLDWFQTPHEMAIACCRRALCYPLYRSWALCRKLLKDVRMILRLGCNQVLKCFFDIHKLLSSDEPRYILNDLYISDYCVWLQSISNERLAALEQSIGKVQLEKKDVDLDLEYLEEAALAVEEEEEKMRTARQEEQPTGHHSSDHSSQGLSQSQRHSSRLFQGQPQGQPQGHSQSQSQDQPNSHSEGRSLMQSAQQEEVVHQVGYPDLLSRATTVPDVVTAHIVRASEMAGYDERDDQGEVDSDDEDDGHIDHQSLMVGEVEESGSLRCTTAAAREVSAYKNCSLESEFGNKMVIANDNRPNKRQADEKILTSSNIELSDSKSRIENGDVNTIDFAGKESNDEGLEIGNEVEVMKTMQDMLNQLSLYPSHTSPSSSSSSSSNREHFPNWSQTSPNKLVEIFEET